MRGRHNRLASPRIQFRPARISNKCSLFGRQVHEARSDSFHFDLKALLDRHPEIAPYGPTANQLTELIETYGDALRSREKYQTDSGNHGMVVAHYISVCNELEEHLLSSLIPNKR